MLVMAASTFYRSGLHNVASLEGAHRTLEPILGSAASTLFAIALLGSGLSSSAVGTLSGQVVMQGFIRRRIPVTIRRLVTMAPASSGDDLVVSPGPCRDSLYLPISIHKRASSESGYGVNGVRRGKHTRRLACGVTRTKETTVARTPTRSADRPDLLRRRLRGG